MNHFLQTGLFGLSLSLSTPLAAQEVTDFTLENGLQVVVIEDHRAPAVVQMLWYKVGGADEVAGSSGIAHFLEHLMFKGTETAGPDAFSDAVEAQGGSQNAFTSWDYTAYFQRVAVDRLDLMMRFESDRMRGTLIIEEDVATERQVVLEERAQRIDGDPAALFDEQMQAAQYLNHPYGRPIIGWRHEMETLDRDDALEFYRIHYAPNNAVLVIAGDVAPDEVRRMATTHYGPIEPTVGLAARERPTEPPQLAERRLSMSDPRVSQPYVTRIYLAPRRQTGAQQEAAALTVLAELLGGSGTTSVLGRALTVEAPTAVYAGASYTGDRLDIGEFSLAVVPLPGVTLTEAEAAMDAAVGAFLADGVDQAALDRIKTQVKAAQVYSQDSAGALAQRYGEALSIGLMVEDVKAWPDALQAVTAEDVMAAARVVLDRSRSVTGHLDTAPEATP